MTSVPLKVFLGKQVAVLALGPAIAIGGTAIGGTVGWLIGRRWWKRRSQRREVRLSDVFAALVRRLDERTPAAPLLASGLEDPARSDGD